MRIVDPKHAFKIGLLGGLSGIVDAAIVNGGPVDKTFGQDVLANMPFGIGDILGDDVGFDHKPSLAELVAAVQTMSRRALLDRTDNAPTLVINAADALNAPYLQRGRRLVLG